MTKELSPALADKQARLARRRRLVEAVRRQEQDRLLLEAVQEWFCDSWEAERIMARAERRAQQMAEGGWRD